MSDSETKTRILLAAKSEFAQKGYAGARMEHIAKNAQANKAMIHYYFGNKEQLYREVLVYMLGRQPGEPLPFEEIFEGLSARERLARVIFFMVHLHFEAFDPDFHKMLSWDVAEGKDGTRFLTRQYFAPGFLKLEGLIQEGIDSGEFETLYPGLVIWNFITFLVTYLNQKECFAGTPVYDKINHKRPVDVLYDFLLTSTMKTLHPSGREFVMPEISKKEKKEILDKIQYFKN